MDEASERTVTEHWRNLPVKEKHLIEALDARNLEAFKKRIRGGGNVNVEVEQGMPLIVYTALYGEPEFMRCLIEAKADLESTMGGGTALVWLGGIGCFEKHRSCASLLLDAGANPKARTRDGGTALDVAVVFRNYPMAQLLREKGLSCRKTSLEELKRGLVNSPEQSRFHR